MLDKREKLSTDRQVDAFLVGFLKPHGTPASGIANISKVQLERYKTMDKIKDTQAVKEAAELMQNIKDTYPETVQQKVYNAYLKIYNSKQSARKKAAEIKKLNAQILELRSKALAALRGDTPSLLKQDVIDNTYEKVFKEFKKKYKDKFKIDYAKINKIDLFNTAERIRKNTGKTMEDSIKEALSEFAKK